MSTQADIVDLFPDGVLHLDADHIVRLANSAMCALTGFSEAELVGRSVLETLAPRGRDGKPLWTDGWHRSASLHSVRGVPEQQVKLSHGRGGVVEALVTARYLRREDGSIDGAVLAVRAASRRAHQAAAGIEIVSTVSHELRSPLTSVKGYTSLLLNRWGRLPDEQRRIMMEQINHDADRVTRLITELLDITRLESGRLFLRRQMVSLPALAERVVEKVAIEYPDLEVSMDFEDGFPQVYADPDKLEQVLTNLVENACKYASRKGIEVRGGLDDGDGDMVCVSVADRGEGIPREDLSRVFTKFFRRAEGRPTGSGLGLWISRGLVEAHGGRLQASSNPGEGSVFRFTLPANAFEDIHGA
ncbi:MAG: PAS domain-containing protein [Actinobacteria bacterium]|nr:PAS domain-containing protein [Actinomycetota bacterium]